MALIDVTELLSDPDFVDPITRITRTAAVDNYGQTVTVETPINTIGSVQPASGEHLTRVPEDLHSSDVRSFWLRGQITASAPGQYPDILVFRGYRYQVISVFDWTNFGSGWCEGLCVAEVMIK